MTPRNQSGRAPTPLHERNGMPKAYFMCPGRYDSLCHRKICPRLSEGDRFWCVLQTPVGLRVPPTGLLSLVNGVTSIIDEAEFDAIRWYSILEEHQVTTWYTAPTAIKD
jgi:acyl-coenzyme A synthetase/AMP-(fatty) acid ligase